MDHHDLDGAAAPGHGLLARGPELEKLAGLLAGAAAGLPRLAVVSGPPGCGATALVETFLAGHPGHHLLSARGTPWQVGEPGALMAQLDPAAGRLAAAGRAAEAARQVLGTLRDQADDATAILWVDSLHWADPASLEALTTLALNLHDVNLFMILALHPRGLRRTPPVTRDVLEGLDSTQLDLAPLDGAAVRELALHRAGVALTAQVAHELAGHTAGNARDLLDLLREVPAGAWRRWRGLLPAPQALVDSTVRQLDTVGGPARSLVEAAAVLGRTSALVRATRLAGLDDPVPALDAAERHGLLDVAGTGGGVAVTFPSTVARAAVYYSLSLSRRIGLHRTAADFLPDTGIALAHRAAAALLPDLDLAGELEAYAASQAEAGAWSKAADALLSAGHLHPNEASGQALKLAAIDALVAAGELPRALTYADEIGNEDTGPARDAVAGYVSILQGRQADAGIQLERAWRRVSPRHERALAGTIALRRVLDSLVRLDGVDLVNWAERATSLADEGSPAFIEAEAIRGLGLGATGRMPEAAQCYAALLQRADLGAQRQRVSMSMGWLDAATDRLSSARVELAAAVCTDFSSGSYRISLWARAWLAHVQFHSGDWNTALRTIDEAVSLQERTGMETIRPLLHGIATRIHALRGNWDLVARHLNDGRANLENYPIMILPYRTALAYAAEARTDYDGVLRALEPLLEMVHGRGIDEPGFWPWQDVYANALVMKDRVEEADLFLQPFEAAAAERDRKSEIARLSYVRGRILGARGQIDDATEAFERGLESLSSLNMPYERSRVYFAYGQTLRRAGKRREAASVLSRAREEFDVLGSDTYVKRCERELQACGSAISRTDQEGLHSLTAQEQAVAELVAAGNTNKQASEELFVSIKTVQYHLTRIYAKLGVGSRTELAARYREAGEEAFPAAPSHR
ncbi:MAG TPA: LuxR C-terminal-related transcriptional regulator [Arthrobacter sp.]|nr:LuxR C-terminal-related transcriptional regulator [Arthrobacter sp.]